MMGFPELSWIALGAAALQVAALVLAALVIERSFGRALSPKLRLGLWLVVVARLAVPVLPTVPLPAWPMQSTTAVAPPSLTHDAGQGAAQGVAGEARRAGGDSMRQATRPSSAPTPIEAADVAADATRERQPAGAATLAPPDALAQRRSAWSEPWTTSPITRRAPSSPSQRSSAVDSSDVLAAVWLIGVAVALARVVRSERRLRRRLARAEPAPALVAQLAVGAAGLVGLRRAPEVVLTDAVRSPAVHGWRRPRVLLPAELVALPPEELTAILVHECCHVRRGDLALAPLLALLRAAWWFHPLAYVALARTASALEEARDADALAALTRAPRDPRPNTPARLTYARVLVRLAAQLADDERRFTAPAPGAIPMAVPRRGLARRVHMILEPRRPSMLARCAGVTLVASLAWAGFVRATPPSQRTAQRSTTAAIHAPEARGANDPFAVVAERPAPTPAWRSALAAQLDAPIARLEFADATLPDALGLVAQEAGVALSLGEDFAANAVETTIRFTLRDVSAREALELLLAYSDDGGYELVQPGYGTSAVRVDYSSEVPHPMELRLYRVRALQEELSVPGVEASLMDDLACLVMECALGDSGAWDMEGASIEPWEGLLCIRQTEAAHAVVHELLDRIARRQLTPTPKAEPWRAALAAKLAAPQTFQIKGARLSDALEASAAQGGVALVHPGLSLDDYDVEVSRVFDDVPLAAVLETCLAETGLFLGLRCGAVCISEQPQLEVQFHPIAGLVEGLDEERRWERLNGIEQFIRSTVDPESWDCWDGVRFMFIGDLLVIRQTTENHLGVAALLAQFERALGGK